MKGLANFLLKEAGLKQVKRMLEAARKNPEMRAKIDFKSSAPSSSIRDYLEKINTALLDARMQKTPPSSYGRDKAKALVDGVVHSGEKGGGDFKNTTHHRDVQLAQQALGRRALRGSGGSYGVVDIFDLGATRPKDKVGVSTPHTTRDPIGEQYLNTNSPNKYKGLTHLPDDPKYPGSHVAKLRQEYAGSKPLAEQDMYHTAKTRPSNRDMRFETVVEGSYLQDKKIGEFTQIPGLKSKGNTLGVDARFWGTAPSLRKMRGIGTRDAYGIQKEMKERMSGEQYEFNAVPLMTSFSSPARYLHSETATDYIKKSKAMNRYRNSAGYPGKGYKPLDLRPEFMPNNQHYHGTNESAWMGASYPSENRYVGKGRGVGDNQVYEPGKSFWTSQLITAVPPNYANHMDLSKGDLYYKTSNPKAFGKAMNKYLGKPIEGS